MPVEALKKFLLQDTSYYRYKLWLKIFLHNYDLKSFYIIDMVVIDFIAFYVCNVADRSFEKNFHDM